MITPDDNDPVVRSPELEDEEKAEILIDVQDKEAVLIELKEARPTRRKASVGQFVEKPISNDVHPEPTDIPIRSRFGFKTIGIFAVVLLTIAVIGAITINVPRNKPKVNKPTVRSEESGEGTGDGLPKHQHGPGAQPPPPGTRRLGASGRKPPGSNAGGGGNLRHNPALSGARGGDGRSPGAGPPASGAMGDGTSAPSDDNQGMFSIQSTNVPMYCFLYSIAAMFFRKFKSKITDAFRYQACSFGGGPCKLRYVLYILFVQINE